MAEVSSNYSSSYPVLVSKLSPKTKEITLTRSFQEFGLLHSVHIMKDKKSGESRLFGYVNFVHENAAQKAAARMNGKKMDGSFIKAEFKSNNRKTSTSSEEKTDFRPLTDCFHFMKGSCQPKNSQVRHQVLKIVFENTVYQCNVKS